MPLYTITSVSGSSSCLFNVYYNTVSASTIASLYGPTIVPASNLTYSQISSGTLIVSVPDGSTSIILVNTCNDGCPPITNIFPQTQTPTPTPTKTPTKTPTQTPTKTPTPTPTKIIPPIGRPFISVWKTTTPNESITLPYDPNGFYDGTINWGDGNVTLNSYGNKTHIYNSPGTYTITITGRILGWSFIYSPEELPASCINCSKIYYITQWGDSFRLADTGRQFRGCQNLRFTATDTLTVNNLTNMSWMFYRCRVMSSLYGLGSWNLSNVTDMSYMFYEADLFNNPEISNWNVSNVENMGAMFYWATSFNQPIGGWNVTSVISMSEMFVFAESFNQPIGNWNVSSVTDMFSMFFGAIRFNQPLSNWERVSPTISTVGNVRNMSNMFYNASLFNQPINNWNVSNVNGMSQMFFNASSFNQPLSNWNVSNVNGMYGMFQKAIRFNQPLSNWERIAPTISTVRNAGSMLFMFSDASTFNQNISNWCVQNIPSLPQGFDTGAISWTLSNSRPRWGVICP